MKRYLILALLLVAFDANASKYSHCDEPQNRTVEACIGYNEWRDDIIEEKRYKEEQREEERDRYETKKHREVEERELREINRQLNKEARKTRYHSYDDESDE